MLQTCPLAAAYGLLHTCATEGNAGWLLTLVPPASTGRPVQKSLPVNADITVSQALSVLSGEEVRLTWPLGTSPVSTAAIIDVLCVAHLAPVPWHR